MSDAAVIKATGKSWNEWFALLDAAGAKEIKHSEIARLLARKHGVGAWWSQGVTVAYERARGLREKGQTAGGFQMSASKTINASAERVFEAWNDAKFRRKWLDEEVTIRKATPAKSLRITWSDGQTSVEVWLTARSAEKTGLSVQHTKIQGKGRGRRAQGVLGGAPGGAEGDAGGVGRPANGASGRTRSMFLQLQERGHG